MNYLDFLMDFKNKNMMKYELELALSDSQIGAASGRFRRVIKKHNLNIEVTKCGKVLYIFNMDYPNAEEELDKLKQKRYMDNHRNHIGKQLSSQLCWDCANACGGCSWSRSFTPIDGWDAKKVKLGGKATIETYAIRGCPEFIRDCIKVGAEYFDVFRDDDNREYYIKNEKVVYI